MRKILLSVFLIFINLLMLNLRVKAWDDFDNFYTYMSGLGFQISQDNNPYIIESYNLNTGEPERKKVSITEYARGSYSSPYNKTRIYEALMYNENDISIKSYVFKIVLKPYQHRLYNGIYCNCYQGKVTVHINLNDSQMLDFAPKNNPSSTNFTFGISVNSSGPNISASMNVSLNELNISSQSSTINNIYHVTYKFSNYSCSDYMSNEVALYGMFCFSEFSDFPEFTVKIDVDYRLDPPLVAGDSRYNIAHIEHNKLIRRD